MNTVYKNIWSAVKNHQKLLTVLIDPDKIDLEDVSRIVHSINQSGVTHIFVGGSTVEDNKTQVVVSEIKSHTDIPVIIFPGDVNQITDKADALLFLSLLSGRNPEYLIGQQVKAVSKLKYSDLEVIPTAYILIGSSGEKVSAVQQVTKTQPLPVNDIQNIVDTAKAGELLGMKLVYLEAGSGASQAISTEVISKVKHTLNIPLIVGGGLKTPEQIDIAFNSGADMVVVGTAFEQDLTFFESLKEVHC